MRFTILFSFYLLAQAYMTVNGRTYSTFQQIMILFVLGFLFTMDLASLSREGKTGVDIVVGSSPFTSTPTTPKDPQE